MSSNGLWQKPLLRLAPVTLRLLCREDGTSIVICISLLTAIMMEQRNKYVHSRISAEFIGEMQQDLYSMELVREASPVGVYKSRITRSNFVYVAYTWCVRKTTAAPRGC